MAVGDPERLDEVVQLADEQLGLPELGAAVRVVRAAPVADLVVVDDRALVAEIPEREEVVVGRAGPAVQRDKRCGIGSEVAGHAIPRLGLLAVEREDDGSLLHVHLRASLGSRT